MSQTAAPATPARKALTSVVAVVAAIGGYGASQMLFAKSPEQKAAELDKALAEVAARENPASPQDMGDGTKLLSVTSGGGAIVYTYSVPSEREIEARYGGYTRDERLKQAICSSPAKALVDAGADFEYVYVKEGAQEELGRSKVWICI